MRKAKKTLTLNLLRSFAFCHAADASSKESEIGVLGGKRIHRKNSNSWLAIRADRRIKYLEEPRYLKSEPRISSICIEFPDADDVYNSRIWKFLALDITDHALRKNIYAQSSQQERLIGIDDAIMNVLKGASPLRGNDLDEIATLICCLRVKFSQKELFPLVCAKLAKQLLLLITKPAKKKTGEILWKYCYKHFIKKHQHAEKVYIHFNDDTWMFVDEYYKSMLLNVRESMYIQFLDKLPSEQFRAELIDDLLNAITCIDSKLKSSDTEHFLYKAKSKKPPIKYNLINIGILKNKN